MNIFSKRETVSQNITFISIMGALNVIFVMITTFLPALSVLLIFVLPLLSTLVWMFCQKKYFLIYVVATLLLSSLFLVFRLSDALFFVLPSIITGLFFGLFIEIKLSSYFTIFLSTLIQVALTYALIPLINFLFSISLIDHFLIFFSLNDFAYKSYLVPTFIFVISLIQTTLTYIVLIGEIAKFHNKENEKDFSIIALLFIELGLIVLSIAFVFVYGPLSLLVMSFAIYFGIYLTVRECYKKKKFVIILTIINAVITFFLFSFLYIYVTKPFGVLLLLSFFIIECFIIFSNYYLEKRYNKDTIN